MKQRKTPTTVLAVRLPQAEADAFRRLADAQARPYGQLLAGAARSALVLNGVDLSSTSR